MTQLQGGVFVGSDGCEHQTDMQSVQIRRGGGKDRGTITFLIGDATVMFNSIEALAAALTVAVSTAPPAGVVSLSV